MTIGDKRTQRLTDLTKIHERWQTIQDLRAAKCSFNEIGAAVGLSHTMARMIYLQPEPSIDPTKPIRPPTNPPRGPSTDTDATGRPWWSYPDEITLGIVREARQMMQIMERPPA